MCSTVSPSVARQLLLNTICNESDMCQQFEEMKVKYQKLYKLSKPKNKFKWKIENLVILFIIALYTALVWYQVSDLEDYYNAMSKSKLLIMMT